MEYMESKMQEHYESGNAMHAELEKVTAERDALAAQVEALRDAYAAYIESGFDEILEDAFAATQQHHLAERDAQKCRAWFIAGYHKMHIEFVGSLASSEGAEFAANQYADSIIKCGNK